MIELTKPNKEIIYLNPFVIESLEKKNYILVTLTNGKKYMVLEPIQEINLRIFNWMEGIFKIKERNKYLENLSE